MYTRASEEDALCQLLSNYRDTPHPATGVAPAAMMFQDSQESAFPRVPVSDEKVGAGRKKDIKLKQDHEDEVNSSKFRKSAEISVGDTVMMRNHRKQSKFQPTFIPDAFKVLDVLGNGRIVIIERISDGAFFGRHPDDIKLFEGNLPEGDTCKSAEKDEVLECHKRCVQFNDEHYDDDEVEALIFNNNAENVVHPRRSNRLQQRNRKYYNSDFQN